MEGATAGLEGGGWGLSGGGGIDLGSDGNKATQSTEKKCGREISPVGVWERRNWRERVGVEVTWQLPDIPSTSRG